MKSRVKKQLKECQDCMASIEENDTCLAERIAVLAAELEVLRAELALLECEMNNDTPPPI